MTCRHSAGDPDCSSSPQGRARAEAESQESERARKRERDLAALTADPSVYSVEEVERVGAHLVMRVRYPSCSKCEFDGNKIMVFLNVGELQAVRWKRIDPHFRPPVKGATSLAEAPSPAARFPATRDGWCDALSYARGKE